MSAKIKLIACDVDGTLVDSRKRVPAGFPEAVRKLRAHGVRFVIASGRQYYNVLKTFDVVKDDVDILSDNGAMLLDKDGAYFTSPLAAEDVAAVCAAVAPMPTVSVLLAGVRAAYMRAASPLCARGGRPSKRTCARVWTRAFFKKNRRSETASARICLLCNKEACALSTRFPACLAPSLILPAQALSPPAAPDRP